MKNIFIILILICKLQHGQTLSGNCTDNISAMQSYNPSTDGYLDSQFLTSYQGNHVATGDYKIFPANGNNCNTLKKVVIVAEGFDLDNSTTVDDVYNKFGIAASQLRYYGYDIVVLNYTDSKDYIERNGLVLVELIKRINNSKVTEDEITVVGASMGGLVSRYALSYMEANNINHQAKLLITFDSPNKGANLAMGVQFMVLDYHNSPITTGPLAAQWLTLMCPSASQLLRHHIISGTAPPALNVNFTKFYNKLRGMNGCFGYPGNCKNIAITLGATNGSGQLSNNNTPMVSGAIAFDYVTSIQAGHVTTYPTSPPLPSTAFGNITQNAGYFVNTSHNVLPSLPLDIAPGGYAEVFGQVADAIAGMPIGSATINKVCDRDCFIPTISALDYKETDLFYNISSDIAANTHIGKTPFDEFFSTNPSVNEEHINNISSTISNYLVNKIYTTVNNVCGKYDNNIISTTYNSNFYNKAQNNIIVNNVIINSGIFDIHAGNELQFTGEVSVNTSAEFRGYIQACIASKSCSYSGNTLRTASKNSGLDFTSENYEQYYNKIKKDKEVVITNVEVFPNPSQGSISIKHYAIAKEEVSIVIEDTSGRIVFEKIANESVPQINLNLKDLVSGIYVLKLTTKTGSINSVEKIVITK